MKSEKSLKRILIALWMGNASGREILSGIFSFAKSQSDWEPILVHLPNGLSSELSEQLRQVGVDGIISCDLSNPILRGLIDATSAPLVVIGPDKKPFRQSGDEVSFVGCNDRAIGAWGARHFLSRGNFNGFGFLTYAKDEVREMGFRTALNAAGKSCSTFVNDQPPGVEIDQKKLRSWIDALPKPAAIMCFYDPLAVEVLNTCRKAGIAVPQQVSVLGVDNDTLICESAVPPLSSIRPDHERAGFLAAKELCALLRGKKTPRHAINCSVLEVVERESTTPLAPSAHLIARAQAFIRNHAANGIDVRDVVAHLGVSRRLADLRFREVLNLSIHTAIEKRRLEIAVQRLKTTHWATTRIAAASGYASVQAFAAAFRKHFNMTPRQFQRHAASRKGRRD